MAGSQNAEDNPVAINVVPMVDVIFCLCVFFMCSMKFKEMEGKFESWLPKNKGADSPMTPSDLIQEVRVMIIRDKNTGDIIRQIGNRRVQSDAELKELIMQGHQDHVRLNKPDTPVIIDGGTNVPWREIVNIVNIVRQNKIEKIEFAMGKDIFAKGKPK